MNKAIGIALLVGGTILLVMGLNARESVDSEISRFFTGSPSDKAIWLIVGGVVAGITGLVLTLTRTKALK